MEEKKGENPSFFFCWLQARHLFLKDSGTTIQIPVTCKLVLILLFIVEETLVELLMHTFSQESPIVGDFKSSTNQKENPDESQCLATLEYVCKTYT